MSNKDKEKKVLPFVDGLAFPLEQVFSNFKEFAKMILPAAFFTTLLCFGILAGFKCTINADGEQICTHSPYMFFTTVFFIFYFSAAIYHRWQLIFAENMTFKQTFKKNYLKKDFKAMLVLFLYFLSWAGAGGGLFWLNYRRPVEDWRIELGFFMVVSIGVFLFVLLLLNAAVFQHFFKGGKFLAINKTFVAIFDNVYKPIAWFMIYFLIIAYLLKLSFTFGRYFSGSFSFFADTFALSCVWYLTVALLSASLYYQEQDLFAEKK